jgi:exosortase
MQIAILMMAILGLYYPFIVPMVADWDQNDNYSHGYLIPFIAAFMIYTMRGELQKTDIKPATWGLIVITIGLCQLIVAKIGSEFFLQRTSLIVVIFGTALYVWGTKVTAKIGLPLLYLLFMVPIPAIVWNRVAFPMQLFASVVTEQVISGIGLPIFREGNVLHLSETSLEVVDACSGLRSLLSMFALSFAFAFFADISRIKKFVLFFSAAPIAILTNIIRLVSTAILAKFMGERAAQGFLHDFSGILVFVIGLALLFLVQQFLSMHRRM